MKTEIHPEYVECRVTCSCGNQFTTRATVAELRVELCAECHPFYTGKQKLVDTGGRVERFTRRYSQAQGTARGSKGEAAPAGGETAAAAEARKPKRKKRAVEAPKSKPPVAIKGGPRPKFEKRPPRGEGRGREGRGEKAPPAAEETAPPAEPTPPEQSGGGQSEEQES